MRYPTVCVHQVSAPERPYRYDGLLRSSEAAELANSARATPRSIQTPRQHWRGILIAAFLLILLIAFALFMAYFLCRRCVRPPMRLIQGERKNYATIVNSRTYPAVHPALSLLRFSSCSENQSEISPSRAAQRTSQQTSR